MKNPIGRAQTAATASKRMMKALKVKQYILQNLLWPKIECFGALLTNDTAICPFEQMIHISFVQLSSFLTTILAKELRPTDLNSVAQMVQKAY